MIRQDVSAGVGLLDLLRSAASRVPFWSPMVSDGKNETKKNVDGVVIRAREARRAPTVKQIPLGVDEYGGVVYLPLFERHTLVCGSSGSGKSFVANRILNEIIHIEKGKRIIAAIDLKGGQEVGKWRGCVDAFGITLEYAALIIANVKAEMDRRSRIIYNSPDVYRESKLFPSEKFPLIVLYIDELAALATPLDDKEEEAVRKAAMSDLNRILFLGRSAGISVITCIQRADSNLLGGFMKNNLQNRLCGRVGSPADVKTVFGEGAASKFPAHLLSDFWFYAMIEGRGVTKFKTPGEAGDADLWRTIENDDFKVSGRAPWLLDKSKTAGQRSARAEKKKADGKKDGGKTSGKSKKSGGEKKEGKASGKTAPDPFASSGRRSPFDFG